MKNTYYLLYTINCRRADCRLGRHISALADMALGGLKNQIVHVLVLSLIHGVHLTFSVTTA